MLYFKVFIMIKSFTNKKDIFNLTIKCLNRYYIIQLNNEINEHFRSCFKGMYIQKLSSTHTAVHFRQSINNIPFSFSML